MSRIANCPACHGEISIPATAQIADQLRCPHCQAQFAVASVLAGSVEAPPEALAVEPPLPNVSAAVGPSLSRVDDLSDVPSRGSRSSGRAKPRGPSLLGQLIGIVGGGAVGLTIGYVVLLRFGGPQYDFLQVADKLPRWALPPAKQAERKHGPDAGDQGPPQRSLADLLDKPDQPPPAEPPVAPPPAADPAPAAVPETPPPAPAPQLGLRNVVIYSSDELGTALAEANAAMGCEHCNSTGFVKRTVVTGVREENGKKVEQTAEKRMPCEVCGGKPTPKMTPEVYQKLSRLADVATCMEDGAGAASAWRRREGVQNLLVKIGSDSQRAESIGRLAGFQLDAAAREQHGVALAGTVQEVGKEGPLYVTRLVLFGLPKVVTVMSSRPAQPAIDVRDRVIILGRIVDNPRDNLVGYEGSLPQVVWGGLPVKLPAAPQ